MSDTVVTAMVTGFVGVVGIVGTLFGTGLQIRHQRAATRRQERREIYFEIVQVMESVRRKVESEPSSDDEQLRHEWIRAVDAEIYVAREAVVKAYLIVPYSVALAADMALDEMERGWRDERTGRAWIGYNERPAWHVMLQEMRDDLDTRVQGEDLAADRLRAMAEWQDRSTRSGPGNPRFS